MGRLPIKDWTLPLYEPGGFGSIGFGYLHHDFVLADDTEVAANELVGKVGIDAARVEQRDLLFERGLLGGERLGLMRQLDLLGLVATPGQEARAAVDRVIGEIGGDG